MPLRYAEMQNLQICSSATRRAGYRVTKKVRRSAPAERERSRCRRSRSGRTITRSDSSIGARQLVQPRSGIIRRFAAVLLHFETFFALLSRYSPRASHRVNTWSVYKRTMQLLFADISLNLAHHCLAPRNKRRRRRTRTRES